ncbi:MAG: hypothetical protein KKB50_03275 [Planctomycetes bacterium]|nr:hypothetical protein [Planctomycetota bacterium]
MRIRRCLAVLIIAVGLLAAAGCQTPGAKRAGVAQGTEPSFIRVGAWNIEWLGTEDRRSGPARGHAQTAADLAEYIAASRVAVLGLEEIARSDEQGPWTSDRLDEAFELVAQRTGGRWQHRLFPASRNQLCGVAWDTTKVTPVGQPRAIVAPQENSAQNRPLWSRPPQGQMFSAGDGLTDFVVIVVHMKSNYGGDFAQHRGEEAQAFVAALPAARQGFADDDLMIVGDVNCSSHAEPAVVAYELAGFVDLNAADQDTHWKYGPLDRIFVPADQPEFPQDRFKVHYADFVQTHNLTAEQFKIRYSDHFMITTELRVTADDD